MRIGLFSDTYYPTMNGITHVVDVARRELENLGHEVFIVCSDGGILRNKLPDEDHILRVPAIQGDVQFALFFPPSLLKKIRELKLDVITFFTPNQLGLMAVYTAKKTHAVLVGQHCGDVYEWAEFYPLIVPGEIAASAILPMIANLSREQKQRLREVYRPRAPKFWSDSDMVKIIRRKFGAKGSEEEDEKFSREIVGASTAMLYAACDAVIAVSPKSADQLQEIAERNRVKLNLEIIPTGVNALPQPSKSDVQNFREKYGLNEDDEIILSVGRVSPEKNLEILLHAFEKISKKNPHAKLIFVGDHNTHFDSKKTYRAKLERLATENPAGEKVIFTGRIEREKLGAVYKIAKVFAFPSLTDTQGLVVQEAAHFGLPIVVCDEFAPAAFQRDKNGFVAKNNADDLADKISQILIDAELARKFGRKSRALATKLTEKAQTEKLLAVFREILQGEYR